MDRATRWLWTGWGLSVLLGFLGPWRRVILATPGSGSMPLYAGVGVMMATMLLARKRPQSFFSALLMSAAGLALGCSLAFLTLYPLTHKPLQVALGGKWLLFGVLLAFAFVRQMRMAVAPIPGYESPSLEGLSREEARHVIEKHIGELAEEIKHLRRKTNWTLLLGATSVLLGAALLGLSHFWPTLSVPQQSFGLTLFGSLALIGGAGLWCFRPSRADRPSGRT